MASVPGVTIIGNDIIPIFIVKDQPELVPVAFKGTGFLIANGLLITCWHCVAGDLPPGTTYAALLRGPGSETYHHFRIERIERDHNGADLATARVSLSQGDARFVLAEQPVARGVDVWTAGYPLVHGERDAMGEVGFLISFRYLQGYIVRPFLFLDPRERSTIPSYEIDMPAPEGLSGAPVIQVGTREVIGVIYGTNDVQRVEEFAGVDPATGQRQPEVVRIVSFALAHCTETLWALQTSSTGDRPLREYLRRPSA